MCCTTASDTYLRKIREGLKNNAFTGTVLTYEDIQKITMDPCDACMMGKMTKLTTIKDGTTPKPQKTAPMEIISSDIVGKIRIMSLQRNRYFVIYVDHATSYVVIYFVNQKSDLFNTITKLKKEHIDYYGLTMKILQADSDSLYRDQKMRIWCEDRLIKLQYSPPHHHESNGRAERCVRTIVEKATTMMIAANAPPNTWEL